jgi:hypothetical protein
MKTSGRSEARAVNPQVFARAGEPNNGMHPTANQRPFYRELGCSGVECAAGEPGVRRCAIHSVTALGEPSLAHMPTERSNRVRIDIGGEFPGMLAAQHGSSATIAVTLDIASL